MNQPSYVIPAGEIDQKLDEQYWARADSDSIATRIQEKWQEYQRWGRDTGYFNRIKTCYERYYSIDENGSLELEKTEDKEVTKIDANHYKSLIQRLHVLVTQNKLSYQPQARNSDSGSQIESDLARGILEGENHDKNMNGILSNSVELCLMALAANIWTPWLDNGGEEIQSSEVLDDGTSETFYTGEQYFEVVSDLDCARSMQLADSPWRIIRVKESKYINAAEYPEHADVILSETIRFNHDDYYLDPTFLTHEFDDDEACFAYYMYHEKNKAIPGGRMVKIIGDAVLFDAPLRYKRIPIFRLKANSVLLTTMADSPATLLIALQQAINLLTSGVLTNNLNNAVQNIWTPDPNTTIRRINNGVNLVISSSEPKGVNFTRSADETYKLMDLLVSWEQLLSGVNSTARGQPESSLKTGNSLALMLAQAVQFVSELQKNYAQVAGGVGSCVINNYQAFANGEHIAYIAGQSRKSYVRNFKAEDLYGIDRITVDIGNPIVQNIAGRYELIQQWMQYGVLRDPRSIINFLRTGEIDSLTEDDFGDSILIREENEKMRRGEVPPVLVTDIHPEHILKHKAIFSDVEVRSNPKIMEAVLSHIQAHIEQMRTMDPDLAAILGIAPLPSMQQPPAGPPAPGGPEMPSDGVEIQGESMPNVPEGTPPEVAANYEAAISGIPSSASAMNQSGGI